MALYPNIGLREFTAIISDTRPKAGSKIIYTDDIVFSSSNLINSHLSTYPKSVSKYLANFSATYSSNEIISFLKKAADILV